MVRMGYQKHQFKQRLRNPHSEPLHRFQQVHHVTLKANSIDHVRVNACNFTANRYRYCKHAYTYRVMRNQ